MKELKLSWGTPDYLSPYWKNYKFKSVDNTKLGYVYGSLPELKESIIKIHKQEQNAIMDDKYIVVANGASQMLQALFRVLGKNVYATPPYFSRFPLLAEQAGVPWGIDEYGGYQIITNPSNPDNRISWTHNKNKIFDLSYNWKQYTDPIDYNQDIMVFSLSKAFGFASTRIGWCVVSDSQLAKKLTDYIEISSGVSIEAQHKACQVINSQLKVKDTCFEYGKDILLKRWEKIKKLNTKLDIINTSGHFLWFRLKNMKKYFKDRNISYMEGHHFGESDEFGRLNLGCSESDFKELLRRINES